MSEFAQLLKDAAGQPPRPLDMASVRGRAARLGRLRRTGVWLCAVLAALGIGVPTGVAPLPSGGRPTDVRTIENGRDARQPTAPEPGVDTVDAVGAPQQPVREVSVAGPARGHEVTASESGVLPTAATKSPATAGSYPPMASCSVYTDGLLDGDVRVCRFTATKSGGWNFYRREVFTPGPIPETWVAVTRNGERAVYRTAHGNGGTTVADGCDDAVIEPGDLVEVVAEPPPSRSGQGAGVGAGAGWGCSDWGPPR